METRMHDVRCALMGATFALIAGCTPTEPDSPPVTFDAVWAGEPWLGSAEARLSIDDDGVTTTLRIGGVNPPGSGQSAGMPIVRSTVAIGVGPFHGAGAYELGEGRASLDYLLGGDVVTATYAIDPAVTGTLIIHESTDDRVSGSLVFEAVSVRSHSPVGERARFVGTFTATVEESSALP